MLFLRAITSVGQSHLPGEGSGGAGDYGDPVALPNWSWVRVIVTVFGNVPIICGIIAAWAFRPLIGFASP